jgi:uncharacterized protein HemY
MRRPLVACIAVLAAWPALAVGPESSRLESDPDYRDAVRLVRSQDYVRAIPILRRLDAAHPREPALLTWLGFAYRKTKAYQTAKQFYDAALAVEPFHRPALEYQGRWFIETGDAAGARANLDKLRRICAACDETKGLEEALKEAGL